MKLFFLLSLSLPCFAQQSLATNLIIESLPQSTGEGISFRGSGMQIFIENPPPLALRQQIYTEGKYYPASGSLYAHGSKTLIVREAPLFWRLISRFRWKQEQKILHTYSPEASALVLSLALGNKRFLKPRFIENTKSSGMSHFFALSGLHLALASGSAIFLFRLLGLNRRLSLTAALPFSAAYMLLGGMGIPLQRAFIFHVLWAFSALMRWNLKLVHVFFLTFCLMMFSGIKEPSFQLSFAALGGIIFLRGFWEDLCLVFFGKYFGAIISTSLAAGLATLPLSIFYFGEFNIYFLLSNILILPFAPLLVLLCLGAGLFPLPLWDRVLCFFYDFLLLFCSKAAQIPKSLIFVENKALSPLVLALNFFGFCIMIKVFIFWRLGHAARKFGKNL